MYLTWSVHLAKKLVYGYATKKKKRNRKNGRKIKKKIKN